MILAEPFARTAPLRNPPDLLGIHPMDMIAAAHPAAPLISRRWSLAFGPIQPTSVSGTSQKIYSRLLDEIGLLGCVHDCEVTIEQVVAHAAADVVTVIRRQEIPMLLIKRSVPGDAFRLKMHAVVISRADGFQAVAQR